MAGFHDLDASEMIVVKKMIGQYASKFRQKRTIIEISLTLKSVHKQGDNEKHEVHAKLKTEEDSKSHAAEFTDKNLYVAIDSVLKKLENMLH